MLPLLKITIIHNQVNRHHLPLVFNVDNLGIRLRLFPGKRQCAQMVEVTGVRNLWTSKQPKSYGRNFLKCVTCGKFEWLDTTQPNPSNVIERHHK